MMLPVLTLPPLDFDSPLLVVVSPGHSIMPGTQSRQLWQLQPHSSQLCNPDKTSLLLNHWSEVQSGLPGAQCGVPPSLRWSQGPRTHSSHMGRSHPQGSERTFSRSTRRAGQVLGLSPLFHHHRKPGSWGSMLYSQLQSSELSSRPSLGPQ